MRTIGEFDSHRGEVFFFEFQSSESYKSSKFLGFAQLMCDLLLPGIKERFQRKSIA